MDILRPIKSWLKKPSVVHESMMLEDVYDLCDSYLWLSMRDPIGFPCVDDAKAVRTQIEEWLADFFRRFSRMPHSFSAANHNKVKSYIMNRASNPDIKTQCISKKPIDNLNFKTLAKQNSRPQALDLKHQKLHARRMAKKRLSSESFIKNNPKK